MVCYHSNGLVITHLTSVGRPNALMYLARHSRPMNACSKSGSVALDVVAIALSSAIARLSQPAGTTAFWSTCVPHDRACALCVDANCSCMRRFLCSAFVLALRDVIRLMFSNPDFAQYAGVRTRAMLDSPYYAHLDAAHNYAISALSSEPDAEASSVLNPALATPMPGITGQGCANEAEESAEEDELDAVEDPDPSDEVMTGEGDTLVLLFSLFVDGVQLKQGNRETTTVVSLKCMDQPGYLVGTNVASYNVAFISGPKEPTCMTDILGVLVHQFKELEPSMAPDSAGVPRTDQCSTSYPCSGNCHEADFTAHAHCLVAGPITQECRKHEGDRRDS